MPVRPPPVRRPLPRTSIDSITKNWSVHAFIQKWPPLRRGSSGTRLDCLEPRGSFSAVLHFCCRVNNRDSENMNSVSFAVRSHFRCFGQELWRFWAIADLSNGNDFCSTALFACHTTDLGLGSPTDLEKVLWPLDPLACRVVGSASKIGSPLAHVPLTIADGHRGRTDLRRPERRAGLERERL